MLYNRHVALPQNVEDLKIHEKLFALAGMDGCIGSTDTTDVPMLNCSSWASINHIGYKMKQPARRYNVTVDHSRLILNVTTGFPASWNDKSIVLYDDLVRGVHDGQLFRDYKFMLLQKGPNGSVIEVNYKGV